MLDNITVKVGQGGILFVAEGSLECACGLLALTVCVFLFLHVFVCLTLYLFTQPSMPRPAFGTSLGLVKLAHFPIFPYSLFLASFHFSRIITSSFSTTFTLTHQPFFNLHGIRDSQTSQTHANTPSITNPKLTLPQNEHCVKAAGTEC